LLGYTIFLAVTPQLIFQTNPATVSTPAVQTSSQKSVSITKTTGTTEQGDVEITLTPAYQNGQLVFSLSANTHSIDLSQFDLKKLTLLTVSDKEFTPVSSSVLQGHHSSGNIVFSLDQKPEKFSVMIQGIPQLQTRTYVWSNT